MSSYSQALLSPHLFLQQKSSDLPADRNGLQPHFSDKHLKKNWSVDRLSKIELAILIVACYELLETDQSREIIINEAVELSKKYCDNDSYKFINGLLNKVVK